MTNGGMLFLESFVRFISLQAVGNATSVLNCRLFPKKRLLPNARTEAIMSIRRAEKQYRLSNPNDFLEKLITIAPVSPDSASLVHACIWFDFSAVQSPLSHQSGNLPSYQFLLGQLHRGVEGGNRMSRRPKFSHFAVTLDCNNQLCNANYPQLSYKRHPAGVGMPPHPNAEI